MMKLILVGSLIAIFLAIVLCNDIVLRVIGKLLHIIHSIFSKLIGKKLYKLNEHIRQDVELHRETKTARLYNYFETIIVNLEMKRAGVTVVGFVFFIILSSILLASVEVRLLQAYVLYPYALGVNIYLVITLFRYTALTRFETREMHILDAIDLIVSDVGSGVQNALVKYKKSINPSIRGYFLECIDNIQLKGYSFEKAILLLNEALGVNFTDFAQKAIIYEKDGTVEDIFSSIIESNRHKRTLRYANAKKFRELRLQFVVSLLIIVGYGIFGVALDKNMSMMLLQSNLGKVLIITDILIVSRVLSYLTEIKIKAL